MRLTKKQAKSIIQSAQLYNDHTIEENLFEYRREIQRRLDFVINNFFGPEDSHMTALILSDDISLYTGNDGEKGSPLFGKACLQLDEKMKP